MSERLLRITAAQLLRALQRDGWTIHHHKGGHTQCKHPPGVRAGACLDARWSHSQPQTLSTALEQAGLTVADLRRLL